MAILSGGGGVYLKRRIGAEMEARPLTLPPLPEGFVYTGIGLAGDDTLFAAWEEQEEYSVGAAGFMVIQYEL